MNEIVGYQNETELYCDVCTNSMVEDEEASYDQFDFILSDDIFLDNPPQCQSCYKGLGSELAVVRS